MAYKLWYHIKCGKLEIIEFKNYVKPQNHNKCICSECANEVMSTEGNSEITFKTIQNPIQKLSLNNKTIIEEVRKSIQFRSDKFGKNVKIISNLKTEIEKVNKESSAWN